MPPTYPFVAKVDREEQGRRARTIELDISLSRTPTRTTIFAARKQQALTPPAKQTRKPMPSEESQLSTRQTHQNKTQSTRVFPHVLTEDYGVQARRADPLAPKHGPELLGVVVVAKARRGQRPLAFIVTKRGRNTATNTRKQGLFQRAVTSRPQYIKALKSSRHTSGDRRSDAGQTRRRLEPISCLAEAVCRRLGTVQNPTAHNQIPLTT